MAERCLKRCYHFAQNKCHPLKSASCRWLEVTVKRLSGAACISIFNYPHLLALKSLVWKINHSSMCCSIIQQCLM